VAQFNIIVNNIPRNMKAPLKYCLITLMAIIILFVGLAFWPYKLVASPSSTLRVLDESGKPLVGVQVTRQWDTSEGQKGEDKSVTDHNGQVNFKGVEFRMSWLKRIAKPLLIFVPASCGPGWEVYGHAEFDIYSPQDYTIKFDDAVWKKVNATYVNHDGIHIYDPTQSNKSYIGLYVFNKREDFNYTLTLFRQTSK
jgi:hypothetical protein